MNIVFLSNNSYWAQQALTFLLQQKVKIITRNEDGQKFTTFPHKYDLGISFLYPHKIELNELIKCHWINFHPAPLPEYRGRNVAYRAILDNAQEFGGTIHYMDETFDTGPLIEVKKFQIDSTYNAGDIINRSHAILYELFKKYIPKFLNGENVSSYSNTVGIYPKTSKINDFISLTTEQQQQVRALTCEPNFYPRINVQGRIYKIIPE